MAGQTGAMKLNILYRSQWSQYLGRLKTRSSITGDGLADLDLDLSLGLSLGLRLGLRFGLSLSLNLSGCNGRPDHLRVLRFVQEPTTKAV